MTDEGLRPIRDLKHIRGLVIRDSGISGVGLGSLAELSKLDSLDLEGSAIDDVGLSQIQRIGSLKGIRLYSTGVTEKGVEALKQSLPDCRVFSEFDAPIGDPGRVAPSP